MRLLSAISEATHQIAINQSLLRNTILKLDDAPEKALIKAFQSKYVYSREHRGFLDVEDNYKPYQRSDLNHWVESTGWSVVVGKECRPVDAVLKTMIEKANTEDGFLSVHDLCFEPERGLIHNKNAYNYLNYWQPVAFAPIEPLPEEMTMWDEYLLFLAGGSESKRELIERWVANAVLFPRQRSLFAMLLYGESKGTGKGTLQLAMDKLLGIYTLKPEDPVNFVTGRFKSGLEGKTLCVFDEVYYDGFGFANHLKQMITEPNFWVEAKGKDAKKIDNHVSILATSNRSQPIWVEAGDRRWMCINVEWNNPRQNGDHPDNSEQGHLVQRVRDWIENDSQIESKLLWLLQKVDLSGWDRFTAPDTPEKLLLQKGSVSNNEDWFKTGFDVGEFLLVKRSIVWEGKRIGKAEQMRIMVGHGYTEVQKEWKLPQGRGSDWMITPRGYEVGIRPEMSAPDVANLIREHGGENYDRPF